MLIAILIVILVVVGVVVNLTSNDTPTKKKTIIKTGPAAESPIEPDITAPYGVYIPTPLAAEEEESPGGLQPSYYEDDDTPVFTDRDIRDSHDSGYENDTGKKRLEDMTPEEIENMNNLSGSIGEDKSDTPCIPELDAMIELAISSGIIKKIDDSNGHVFVGAQWYSMSIDSKNRLAEALAYYLYCKKYPFHNGKWVSIYDWYSGEQIFKETYF